MAIECNHPVSLCALCLKSAKLFRSHIIPKFMYREMRDEKNRILTVSDDPAVKDKLAQDGPKEHLLCEGCEALLSRDEDYACRVIYGGPGVKIDARVEGPNTRFSRLDYAKLKLFFLSLLWRMSISKNPFFSAVDLGPYNEKARSMLLARNPGREDEFGVICIFPRLDGEPFSATAPPHSIRHNETVRIYRCLIDGFLFCFIVSRHGLPGASPRLLNANGEWVIESKEIAQIPYLLKDVRKFRAAIDIRDGLIRRD